MQDTKCGTNSPMIAQSMSRHSSCALASSRTSAGAPEYVGPVPGDCRQPFPYRIMQGLPVTQPRSCEHTLLDKLGERRYLLLDAQGEVMQKQIDLLQGTP